MLVVVAAVAPLRVDSPTEAVEYYQLVVNTGSTRFVLLFLVLSLLMGEIIDTIRSLWEGPPHLFQLILYDSTNDRSVLTGQSHILLLLNRSHRGSVEDVISATKGTETEFLDYLRDDMDIDSECTDVRILYFALRNHLDQNMSSITEKRYINYMFAENSIWALLIGLSLIVAQIPEGTGEIVNALIAAYILLLLFSILLWHSFSRLYIESLLMDYLFVDD